MLLPQQDVTDFVDLPHGGVSSSVRNGWVLGLGGSGASGRRGRRVSWDLYVKLKNILQKNKRKEKEMKVGLIGV